MTTAAMPDSGASRATALVCPACRRLDASGALVIGALDGSGRCDDCGRQHRVVRVAGAEITIVLRHDDADAHAMTERAMAWIASGPTPTSVPRLDEAAFVDSGLVWAGTDYGPRIEPACALPAAPWLTEWLAASTPSPASLRGLAPKTLILGAGAGGVVLDFAASGADLDDEIIAVDASPWGIAVGAMLGAGARALPVASEPGVRSWWPNPLDGRQRARLAATRWLLADALDPPFAADAFDRVLALNLVDSVADPWLLMGQIAALLRPGGRVLITTPWCLTEAVTPRALWPTTAFRAALPDASQLDAAVAWLEGSVNGDWDLFCVKAETGLLWSVRSHARMTTHYAVDAVLLQKP